MNTQKYVLGMGDTEYLRDGIFTSEHEAHAEAARLKNIPTDNSDFHSQYTIAKIASSIDLAKDAMNGLSKQTAEFFTEILGEVECFGDMDGDLAVINADGVAKLEATLMDILENHTEYPRNEAVAVSEVFKFEGDTTYAVSCPNCSAGKLAALSLNQRREFSEYATTTCDKCEKVFMTKYNKANDSLTVDCPLL